jgi:hypothetical protein
VRELRAQAAIRACESRAVAQAVSRVRDPALKALHRDRRGGSQFG